MEKVKDILDILRIDIGKDSMIGTGVNECKIIYVQNKPIMRAIKSRLNKLSKMGFDIAISSHILNYQGINIRFEFTGNIKTAEKAKPAKVK